MVSVAPSPTRRYLDTIFKHMGPGLHPNGSSQAIHAGKGGGWRPSMTRADAEDWARDSVLQGTYTHGTGSRTVERIRSHGFKASDKGILGEGIYLGYGTLEIPTPVDPNARFNSNALMRGRNAGLVTDVSAFQYGDEVLLTKVNVTNPFVYELTETPFTYDDVTIEVVNAVQATVGGNQTSNITSTLAEAGYDALVVTDPSGTFDWALGGDQIVVFDRKNIVVISDETPRYVNKHLGSRHDQKTHGNRGGARSIEAEAAALLRDRQRVWASTDINTLLGRTDLGGFDALGAAQVTTVVAMLSEMFPHVADRIAIIEGVEDGAFKLPGVLGESYTGSGDRHEAYIKLSATTASVPTEMFNEMLRESQDSGYCAEDEAGWTYVITHEFAHHMTYAIGKKRVNAMWAAVQGDLFPDNRATENWISRSAREVSSYATSHSYEFIAEAFTEYLWSPEPSRVAQIVATHFVAQVRAWEEGQAMLRVPGTSPAVHPSIPPRGVQEVLGV
jgi:hypothetical protein